jgi:uncharacterized membrane protein YfcA
MLIFVGLTASNSVCSTNNNCTELYICDNGACRHKDIFPISYYDVLGSICIICVSALANASGLGGGPLMTIIMLVIFKFSLSDAVPLSQLAVLSGTFVGTLLRLHLRHPTRDKPAIDYEFLLLIITPLLLGTSLGVLLEMISPVWVVLGLLTLILVWITFESASASIRAYNVETKERTQLIKPDHLNEESPEVMYVSSDQIAIPLKKILDSERQKAPLLIVSILFLIYIFNVAMSFFRDSHYLNITPCSSTYWIFIGCSILSSLFIMLLISIYLKYRTRKKINVGYNFDDCDLIWNFRPSFICSLAAMVAGLSAGLLSIGGGIVMTPIMLKLGLRPQVVVPTSSVLYVLTSSTAIVFYIISDKLLYSYSVLVSGSCFIGSILGIFGIKLLVNRFKRASLMIICMAFLLAICTIIVPVYGIIHFSSDLNNSINKYCTED